MISHRFHRHLLSGIVVQLALLAFLAVEVYGQVEEGGFRLLTLSANGSGTVGIGLKQSFETISGVGGNVEARFALFGNFTAGVEFRYLSLNVDQKDAVTQWNWVYWNKYYRSYINTDWHGDSVYFNGKKVKTSSLTNEQVTSGTPLLRKDGIYQATIVPVQGITLAGGGLNVGYTLPISETFVPFGTVGISMYEFTRSLYTDEQWWKKRVADAGPDSGQVYTFHYGFRNYATKITGEVYSFSVAAGTDVILSDLLAVRVAVRYDGMLTTIGDAYGRFPMQGYATVDAGLVIRY